MQTKVMNSRALAWTAPMGRLRLAPSACAKPSPRAVLVGRAGVVPGRNAKDLVEFFPLAKSTKMGNYGFPVYPTQAWKPTAGRVRDKGGGGAVCMARGAPLLMNWPFYLPTQVLWKWSPRPGLGAICFAKSQDIF